VSQIHVVTLLQELDKAPAGVHELAESTGYPTPKVLTYIIEARAAGHVIVARWGGEIMTEYSHSKKGCPACGDNQNV